jgi:uncharacterized OsmC-like protein
LEQQSIFAAALVACACVRVRGVAADIRARVEAIDALIKQQQQPEHGYNINRKRKLEDYH